MATARIAVILSVVLSSLLLLSNARATPNLDVSNDSNALAVRDQQPDPAAAGNEEPETLTLETSKLLPAAGDVDEAFRYLDFSLRQPFRRHRFLRRPIDRQRVGISHRFGFGFGFHRRHHHHRRRRHHHHHHHDGEMMAIPGAAIAGQEVVLPGSSAERIIGREVSLPVKSAEWIAAVERRKEERKGRKEEHKKKKYESDSDSDSDSDELEEKEWKKAKKELKMKREREERAKSGAFGWFWALAKRLID